MSASMKEVESKQKIPMESQSSEMEETKPDSKQLRKR